MKINHRKHYYQMQLHLWSLVVIQKNESLQVLLEYRTNRVLYIKINVLQGETTVKWFRLLYEISIRKCSTPEMKKIEFSMMSSFQVVWKISGHHVTIFEANLLTVGPRTEYPREGFILTENSALAVRLANDIIHRLSLRQGSPCSFEWR